MRNAECSLLRCAWFALLALLTLVGCGDGKTEVSGMATFDGQPIETGTISFVPLNDPAAASDAGEINNGAFEIAVSPGEKKVVIRASRPITNAAANDPDAANLREDYIPAKYNRQSELTATITPDTEPLRFELNSQ